MIFNDFWGNQKFSNSLFLHNSCSGKLLGKRRIPICFSLNPGDGQCSLHTGWESSFARGICYDLGVETMGISHRSEIKYFLPRLQSQSRVRIPCGLWAPATQQLLSRCVNECMNRDLQLNPERGAWGTPSPKRWNLISWLLPHTARSGLALEWLQEFTTTVL